MTKPNISLRKKRPVQAVSLLCMMLAVMMCAADAPALLGRMVDLSGHRLHVNCSGTGQPTVVIENGLGDFSFDWVLVQTNVEKFTRICPYDRAGYAWSDPGPKPRTFTQINLELRDALAKVGEKGPFVLVGHSYGGPLIRNFATNYPKDVAGMVQVDAAFEGMRVAIGGGKTMKLGEDPKGGDVPNPREEIKESDKPSLASDATAPPELQVLDSMYKVLPEADQKLQPWAQKLIEMQDAEGSQMDWSGECFKKWLTTSQSGALGAIPVVVLTRAEGGYGNDQDIAGAATGKGAQGGAGDAGDTVVE